MSINTNLGSFRKWKIGSEIRNILLQDEAIGKMVGTKVYPVVAPEGTEDEFIVYRREKYSKEVVHQGVYMDSVLISVTTVSDSYDTAAEIADKIDLALIGEHITKDKKKIRIQLEDSSEGFADNKYYQSLVLRVS